MKQILSLVVVLLLIVSFSASAFAADKKKEVIIYSSTMDPRLNDSDWKSLTKAEQDKIIANLKSSGLSPEGVTITGDSSVKSALKADGENAHLFGIDLNPLKLICTAASSAAEAAAIVACGGVAVQRLLRPAPDHPAMG